MIRSPDYARRLHGLYTFDHARPMVRVRGNAFPAADVSDLLVFVLRTVKEMKGRERFRELAARH